MKPIIEPEQQIDQNNNRAMENPEPPYEKLDKDSSIRSQKGHEVPSIEMVFKNKDIPTWKDQLTIRSLVVSIGLGCLFTALLMKQSLSTGILSPVNMYAGVVGFSCIKTWIMIIDKCGVLGPPFTRQENTIIQACVLGITGVGVSGGFQHYLFAMSLTAAKQRFPVYDDDQNIKNPSLGWIIPFMLITCFVGVFFIVPFGKIMIVNFKLLFPSGQAIGYLINTIQAPLTTKFARKQVTTFGKFFSFSFFWSCLNWLFTGGPNCGLSYLPLFGFSALKNNFYWDFMGTYVGVGMMCPYSTSISLLIGSIISWAFMFPYIKEKKGDWYAANTQAYSIHGIGAYKIFIGLALMIGDSLYQILRILIVLLYRKLKNKDTPSTGLPVSEAQSTPGSSPFEIDEQFRTQNFLKDPLSTKHAMAGCVTLVVISTVALPLIFPQVKWYYVLSMYVICPIFAFCKTHAAGYTDMNIASNLGKLSIIIFGAWAGASHGGLVVGLVSCGVIVNFVSSASDLMVDFKTGYFTVASPKSIFIGKVIGIALGCFISPLIFSYFLVTYPDFGSRDSIYKAAFAPYYREIAIFGLEGFAGLPKNCVSFCYAFFALGIVINIIRDVLPKKVAKFVPIPIIMGVPFAIGGYLSVDFCVGSLIIFLWKLKNKAEADVFAPIIASALICGDGLWTLQTSIFALISWQPPVCVQFVPRLE